MPASLSAPRRRRPAPAARAQSVRSGPKIWKNSAAAGKDPVHRANFRWIHPLANPPKLAECPHTGFSEMLPRASSNVILQRRTDRRKTVRWHGVYAGPTALGSLFGSGFAGDLVIPGAMKCPRPGARHVCMNHRAEAAFFQNIVGRPLRPCTTGLIDLRVPVPLFESPE